MFAKMLSDAVDVVSDVTTVVAAPAAIALDTAAKVTKPMADMAKEVVEAVVDREHDPE